MVFQTRTAEIRGIAISIERTIRASPGVISGGCFYLYPIPKKPRDKALGEV